MLSAAVSAVLMLMLGPIDPPRMQDLPAHPKPVPVERIEPRYPVEARTAQVEGTVTLQVVIDAQGEVSSARVVRTDLRTRPNGRAVEDNHGLGMAAIEAVVQWRFEPARKDGTAVESQAQLPVLFRLN